MPKLKELLSPESAVWIYFILQLAGDIILYSGQYYAIPEVLANILSYLAFLMAILSIGLYSIKRRKIKLVFIILFIATIILISNRLMFPSTAIYFEKALKDIFLRYIPLMLMFSIIWNYKAVIEWMNKYIVIYYGLAFILIYLTFTGQVYSEDVDYMTVSYNVLLPISCLGLSAFLKKNVILFIIFLASAISLFIIGCRGAFFAALVPCFIYLFQYNKKLIVYLVIASIIVLINFQVLIQWISDVLTNIGYDSRTLTRIAFGEAFTSSGREVIQQAIYNYLNKWGYHPYGLFGDRVILHLTGHEPTYVHNIIFEIIIDFGWFIGSCLLIVGLVLLRNSFRRMDYDGKIFAMTLYTCCIVKLMLSNSYLVDPIFYVCLGIAISSYSKKKRLSKTIKKRTNEKSIDTHVRYDSVC